MLYITEMNSTDGAILIVEVGFITVNNDPTNQIRASQTGLKIMEAEGRQIDGGF